MIQHVSASRPPKKGRKAAQLLPADFILTRHGSRLYDLEWDFSKDHPSLGVMRWNVDIVASGVTIGNLADPAFDRLRHPLQEAIVARWKYRRREDGQPWQAKRVANAVRAARAFAAWAAAKGITSVTQVDEAVFQSWLSELEVLKDGKTPRQLRDRKVMADPVLLVWRMRDRVSESIGFVPSSGETGEWVRTGPQSEPVPLIPAPVLSHLVGAAIRYVEIYASDILAARTYLDQLAKRWEQEFGRPAPQWTRGSREYIAFDAWVGARFGTNSQRSREAMGAPAPWNEDGQFVRDPDSGQPWLDGIRTRNHLQQLENSLRTAAYVVIAFTTGGRSSELNLLKVDCARTTKQLAPRPALYSIKGQVTKHRGREPEDVTWGVPEVAVQSAGMLIRMLASWRAKTGSDRLLVTQTGGPMDGRLANVDLKVFLERIGAPYVDGKPFPVSPHMLRVALAQWLAQEPYGEIAGAIHLKQLSTAAFRGYLRQDPQFKSLFESFAVQAQADHLEMVMNEPVVLGRQGAEIVRSRTPAQQAELEAQVRTINFAQAGRDAPSPRTMAKLKKSQRPVYKTKLTMCFFKGAGAECLKGQPATERTRPITHRCEPLTCANSAITRLQVPAYLEDFEEFAALIADAGHSPSQVALYQVHMSELAKLIVPFLPTLAAEQAWLQAQLSGADPREASSVGLRERSDEVARLLNLADELGVLTFADRALS